MKPLLLLLFLLPFAITSCEPAGLDMMYIYYVDNKTDSALFISMSFYNDSVWAYSPAKTKVYITKQAGENMLVISPRRLEIYKETDTKTPIHTETNENAVLLRDINNAQKLNWKALPDSLANYPNVYKRHIFECVIPITPDLLSKK